MGSSFLPQEKNPLGKCWNTKAKVYPAYPGTIQACNLTIGDIQFNPCGSLNSCLRWLKLCTLVLGGSSYGISADQVK